MCRHWTNIRLRDKWLSAFSASGGRVMVRLQISCCRTTRKRRRLSAHLSLTSLSHRPSFFSRPQALCLHPEQITACVRVCACVCAVCVLGFLQHKIMDYTSKNPLESWKDDSSDLMKLGTATECRCLKKKKSVFSMNILSFCMSHFISSYLHDTSDGFKCTVLKKRTCHGITLLTWL